MQFEVPYRDGASTRRYLPDFIVRIDDGGAEPLNLVLEIKGYPRHRRAAQGRDDAELWVPGVNNLGTYGRWAFAEFTDVFEIEAAFGTTDRRLCPRPATEPDRGTPMPRPPKPQAGPSPIETLTHDGHAPQHPDR